MQWCQLQKRKQNMVRLLEKMQTYQGDLVMKDINAALPDGMRVLSSDDIDRVGPVDDRVQGGIADGPASGHRAADGIIFGPDRTLTQPVIIRADGIGQMLSEC